MLKGVCGMTRYLDKVRDSFALLRQASVYPCTGASGNGEHGISQNGQSPRLMMVNV